MLSMDVTVRRGDFALRVAADLHEPITGVLGPSGAGKSTLLACVAGLVRPDGGRIELDGRALCDRSAKVFLPPHKRRVGVVFQDALLLPNRTVRGNLEFGRRLIPRRERRFTVRPIAELLGIAPLLDRRVLTLSGGEARRVAIGRAILMNPRLMLLDEPLTGLDRARKRSILPCLRALHETTGVPMLMVSHQLEEVLTLTDRLLLLENGRVAGQGRYIDLLAEESSARLLGSGGLSNVLTLTVLSHCHRSGVTRMRWEGARDRLGRSAVVKAPMAAALRAGTTVRGVLSGRDVALALAPVEHISMQNQFPGRIEAIRTVDGRTVCVVDVGVPLAVEVTGVSRGELTLREGGRIWCLFKTHSLEVPFAGGRLGAGGDLPAMGERQQRTTRGYPCESAV